MTNTVELQPHAWQLAEECFAELLPEVEARLAASLGRLALRGEVQYEATVDRGDETTLYTAVHEAALGDEAARALIHTNVTTDVSERLFKIGRSKVTLDINAAGQFVQHGRRLIDIHSNTLAYTELNDVMYRRTIAEMHNLLFAEALIPTGVLDTHDLLVFSPAPYDEQTKREFGFFSDTDSCSIQLMQVDANAVTLETALVAGKASPSSQRHDIAAIQRIAADAQVDIMTEDADDIVRYAMLVPKEQTHDGVQVIVQRYDESIGDVFWGETSVRNDYDAFVLECEERERAFASITEQITEQLIREASAFQSPLEVIARLDELSERYCVRAAVSNEEVNAKVFGVNAAMHIEEARLAMARGDMSTAQSSLNKAQKTAVSGSCPLRKLLEEATENTTADDKKSEMSDGKKKWMKCPHCDARVFDDPCAQVLSCWDCHALVINGKVKSTGNGGSKRRQQEREAQKQAAEKPQQTLPKPVDNTQQHADTSAVQPPQNIQERLETRPQLATL